MKIKAIALALIVTMTGVAHADEDVCVIFYKAAEAVMIKRQEGTPITLMMSLAGDNEINREMVKEAYRSPQFSTPDMRKRTIAEFANEVASMCYDAYK